MAPRKVPCICGCGDIVSESTVKRHLRGKKPSLSRPSPYPKTLTQTLSNLKTTATSSIRVLARNFARQREHADVQQPIPRLPAGAEALPTEGVTRSSLRCSDID